MTRNEFQGYFKAINEEYNLLINEKLNLIKQRFNESMIKIKNGFDNFKI